MEENGTEIRGEMKQSKVKGKGVNSGPRRVGGGVGIFIDRKYESAIIQEVSVFIPKVFESLFVKVKLSENRNLLIGNIYRPPQTSIRDFTEILNTVLVQIREDTNLKKSELIRVGDIDLLKTEIHVETSKYLDTLLDHNLLPVISKPTRITQSTATLIDHIFAQNIHENSKSGILLESLSDHCPTYYL